MLFRTATAMISCLTLTNIVSAQENNLLTNVDYKNDISLSVTNVIGNDLYNGTGPALVYRKWIKPNVAIKVGAGVAYSNSYSNEILYKVNQHEVARHWDRDDKFIYGMFGFEAKKQVFKNFAIYYGAHVQLGGVLTDKQHYNTERNVAGGDYSFHIYNDSYYNYVGFQTTFTPIVGVKYQFLKRMELGTEFRTFNLSTYMSSRNSTLDVNAQLNANMYLTYRFGKR